jgi:hypothetical protein
MHRPIIGEELVLFGDHFVDITAGFAELQAMIRVPPRRRHGAKARACVPHAGDTFP